MTRTLCALLLAATMAVTAVAQHVTPAAEATALLKARVLQLEVQVQQQTADLAVCGARLAHAGNALAVAGVPAYRQAIETEAGCAIDWVAEPPACADGAGKP